MIAQCPPVLLRMHTFMNCMSESVRALTFRRRVDLGARPSIHTRVHMHIIKSINSIAMVAYLRTQTVAPIYVSSSHHAIPIAAAALVRISQSVIMRTNPGNRTLPRPRPIITPHLRRHRHRHRTAAETAPTTPRSHDRSNVKCYIIYSN